MAKLVAYIAEVVPKPRCFRCLLNNPKPPPIAPATNLKVNFFFNDLKKN